MKHIECDIVVVGGGPAGLAAACSAYDAGAKNIVLIERDTYLGGILPQCIHNGFGLHFFQEDLTGPEYAEKYIAELNKRSIDVYTDCMVIGVSKQYVVTAVSSRHGIIKVCSKAVVLAMGCREKTRGAVRIPGSRPSGIYTAGTAQRFINVEGYLPGREIVIVGSGDIGMIMARRLCLEGCTVKAVVEVNKNIGGLSRNLSQCLYDYEIPLYLNHTISKIYGNSRVEGVDIFSLNQSGNRKKRMRIACDTILLSVGLIPENELLRQI